MPLNRLLDASRIGLLAESADRTAVLDAAAHLLAGGAALSPSMIDGGIESGDSDSESIFSSLCSRERLASTAIGFGVAIPHGRIASLQTSRGAFLRLAQPVEFGAMDGQLVDLVLALAVPEHYVNEHLQQLAEIASNFSDQTFRDALRAAPDTDALRRCLLGDKRHRHAA